MAAPFQSVVLLLLLLVPVFHYSSTGVAAFLGSSISTTTTTTSAASYYNVHRGKKNSSPSPSKLFFGPDNVDIDAANNIGLLVATAAVAPELESEVLLDVSHLFLDFSAFLTASKPVLKVAQVIGRILILAQDYIPDKHVSPEELGIQVLMITVCIAKRGEQQQQQQAGSNNSTNEY